MASSLTSVLGARSTAYTTVRVRQRDSSKEPTKVARSAAGGAQWDGGSRIGGRTGARARLPESNGCREPLEARTAPCR